MMERWWWWELWSLWKFLPGRHWWIVWEWHLSHLRNFFEDWISPINWDIQDFIRKVVADLFLSWNPDTVSFSSEEVFLGILLEFNGIIHLLKHIVKKLASFRLVGVKALINQDCSRLAYNQGTKSSTLCSHIYFS